MHVLLSHGLWNASQAVCTQPLQQVKVRFGLCSYRTSACSSLHGAANPISSFTLVLEIFSDFETPRSKECALKQAHFGGTAPSEKK